VEMNEDTSFQSGENVKQKDRCIRISKNAMRSVKESNIPPLQRIKD